MSDAAARIEITVRPEYAGEHSAPEQGRFVFIYHISIHNTGDASAQLLRRHWIITDAEGRVEEVEGEGVIGQQPTIPAGGEHAYQSFCVLETPVGCMQGSYQMLGADGESFTADIAPFTLAAPGSLN